MIKKILAFIKKEKTKGRSFVNILMKGIVKVENILNNKNVYYGYKKYNKPFLISYSRSGTNWIRYFIEIIANKPTPGQFRIQDGTDYYIDRAHAGFVRAKKHNKIILVLRDYKSCIARHHNITKIRKNYESISDFLNKNDIQQPAIWYYYNIKAFEDFDSEKLLLYYEDILSKPKENFTRLGKFLNLNEQKTISFIKNIDNHKSNSIDAYTSGGHKSLTGGDIAKNHHNSKLSEQEANEFDNYFKKDIYIFNKYLKRYE